MKFIALLGIISIVLLNLLGANEPLIEKKKVPIRIALPLLKSIDKHAIIIGNGPTDMYAFIDPVCPRSRDFVEMVFENKKMQTLYTYHFFFYELKRFNTHQMITDIYASDNAVSFMEKIMIEKKELTEHTQITQPVQKKIKMIEDVANKLDIYKRPYLFIDKSRKEGK